MPSFKSLGLTLFVIFGLACLSQTAVVSAQETSAAEKVKQRIEKKFADDKVRDELNAKLKERISGVKFVGRFTMLGKEDQAPNPEEYHIISAEKLPKGDMWRLAFRIKYGGKDIVVPGIDFEIKWADRTPVITVDNLTIPLVGTFDSRVLIRRNMYSGTWAHGQIRGHLFGRIEKLSKEELAKGQKQLEEMLSAGDE